MPGMGEPAFATGSSAIHSYHAHIYFQSADERESALQLRAWIGERFTVQLGRVHEVAIGPHSAAMYQVAFANESFAALVPWLMLNRRGLSILVHPNTGRALDDHLVHALWLGRALAINEGFLSNLPEPDSVSPVEPNTVPVLPSE
jgi:aromatic ring-cleaving dioxygenase